MSERIIVNPESLQEVNQRFKYRAEVHEQNLAAICGELRTLRSVGPEGWIGDAANQHFAEMEQFVIPGYKRLIDALNEAVAVMKYTQNEFDTADREGGKHFRQLVGTDSAASAHTDDAASTVANNPNAGPGVNAEQLMKIAPNLSRQRASALVPHINAAMERFGINSPEQQAMFLAQTAHESGGFSAFRERGSEAYFNEEYNDRLGNHLPDDGARFRGRGAIQITGRGVYQRHGKRIGMDLVANPALAERDDVAFLVSASYWTARRPPPVSWFTTKRSSHDWSWIPATERRQSLNEVAQSGTSAAYDYTSVGINPWMPYNRLGKRRQYFERSQEAFGLSDTATAD